MKAAANFKQVLERRRGLAISITIVGGLLIGLDFSLWPSEQPYRKRSVSRLIADLQKQDSRLQPFLRAVLGDRYAPTPAINVRLNAAAELRRREPKPTNALPVLRLLLRGPDLVMRGAALEVLEGLGTAAHSLAPDVKAFVEDQVSSPIDVRVQAITALARIAPDDPATVLALIAALNETPTNSPAAGGVGAGNTLGVPHAAASALGGVARPGNRVVPALVAALKDSEPGFASAIVDGLARAGPEEREVVPAVIGAFERSLKPPTDLRSQDAAMLAKLSDSPEARTFRGLEVEWGRFRSQALAALQKLARSDNGAVAALLSALSEEDAGFASEILFALGRIGAMTPKVIPAIVNVMERSSLPAAFEALAQIGPPAVPAVPNLLAMLQPLVVRPQPLEPRAAASRPQDTPPPGLFRASPPPEFASRTERRAQLQRLAQLGRFSLPLQTIGRIGPIAREALPVLTTIIQVQTNLWRYEALMARWQIDRSTESALPGLIAGMADPERETRLRLVQCFQDMGTEGLDGLLVALRDADYEVRRKAALALGALGPAAERSVPYLKPLLEDPENIVRFVAEHALKQIRPAEARKWKTKLRMPEKSPERAPSG